MGAATHPERTNPANEIIDSLKILIKEEDAKISRPEDELRSRLKRESITVNPKAKGDDFFREVERLGSVSKDGGTRTIDFAKLAQQARAKKAIYEHNAAGLNEFAKNMSEMPQGHLSLAHDIIDLNNTHAFVNHDIFPVAELNALGTDAITHKEVSFIEYIFNMLPKLSKENPAVLDLIGKVFSNSDEANAKFFLKKFFSMMPDLSQCAKQIKETESLVPEFAQSFLKSMPSMDMGKDCKENLFYNAVLSLCGKDTKPENIKALKSTIDITDKFDKVESNINLDDIRLGDTKTIEENLDALPYLMENAQALGIKDVDVSGFLTRKAV